MNSYDIAQKLLQGPVAAAKAKHEAKKAENEARRSKKTRRAKAPPKPTANVWPFYKLWRTEMFRKFPDLPEASIPPWYRKVEGQGEDGETRERVSGGKEVGQVARLLQRFDAKTVARYFLWAIDGWETLRERFPKTPEYPTVGWLLAMSDSLIGESQKRPETP